jgi:hypothetical protein
VHCKCYQQEAQCIANHSYHTSFSLYCCMWRWFLFARHSHHYCRSDNSSSSSSITSSSNCTQTSNRHKFAMHKSCTCVYCAACASACYTMPQWFSIAPNTLLIAAAPLSGYSLMLIISSTSGCSAIVKCPAAIAPTYSTIGASSGSCAANSLGLYSVPWFYLVSFTVFACNEQ